MLAITGSTFKEECQALSLLRRKIDNNDVVMELQVRCLAESGHNVLRTAKVSNAHVD